MESRIDIDAKQKLDFTIGNVLGILATADALCLWAFYFFAPAAAFDAGRNPMRIVVLVAFSVLLPCFAAWKSSRLWLLMLLNPIALLTLFLTTNH
jgi:hypothetical protein